MGVSPNEPDNKSTPPTTSTVLLLLGTIADTTWRMFVPTIALITLGYFADQQLKTWPWLFIVGIVLGFSIAGLLIKKQLSQK